MPTATANELQLAYETFGQASDPAMLLIMGLGGPMIMWEEEFCRGLAERGFFVIRYDNRDCGRSTKLDALALPDLATVAGEWMQGGEIEGPYRLSDMAADAAGLLDALGIERAHAVGASMGGMIAQTLAIEAPDRVASLTSIMSSTGQRSLPDPSPEAADPAECEMRACDSILGWGNTSVPDDTVCVDASECLTALTCVAGSCDGGGEPMAEGDPCDDGYECSSDSYCDLGECVSLTPNNPFCADVDEPTSLGFCAAGYTGSFGGSILEHPAVGDDGCVTCWPESSPDEYSCEEVFGDDFLTAPDEDEIPLVLNQVVVRVADPSFVDMVPTRYVSVSFDLPPDDWGHEISTPYACDVAGAPGTCWTMMLPPEFVNNLHAGDLTIVDGVYDWSPEPDLAFHSASVVETVDGVPTVVDYVFTAPHDGAGYPFVPVD